jgi:molybdopterin-guanine dinucleotide biosynthesis protein A
MALTALVLAGGRGARMGGLDKGLVLHEGRTLAAGALEALRPQVAACVISANRHLEAYAALGIPFGAPVWPDDEPGFHGPLAAWCTALPRIATPWLLSWPCDLRPVPEDFAQRLLAAATAAGSPMAVAEGADGRGQPLAALLHHSLAAPLAAAFAAGERAAFRFAAAQRAVPVRFEAAFANLNRPEDLEAEASIRPPPAARRPPSA